jgi:Amino acid permease
MIAGHDEAGGLARGVVGSARTIAFGTSIVAPSASAAVLSPASSPNRRLADLTDAMIYGFTAFAGFGAAAALGEEAKNSRRSVPVSIVGIVVVTGVFYLLVVCAEAFAAGRHGIAGLIGCLAVIRAFRTEFRDEFRLGRHLLIAAAASVVFLFPLWGSCSLAPTRWRTCCPSFLWAGS